MKKDNLAVTLASLALVTAVAGTGGPALARAVVNADKVDGLSAVKSSASTAKRKGKLVATSPQTGRLPDNIIGTAPDAAKVGGVTAAQLRSAQLSATGADLSGGAAANGGGGVNLPNAATPRVVVEFVLPADYRPGTRVGFTVAVLAAAAGCSFQAETEGGVIVPERGNVVPVTFPVSGSSASGQVAIPPIPVGGSVGVVSRTFTGASPEFRAGRVVAFVLSRDADVPADNCTGAVTLSSFLATY